MVAKGRKDIYISDTSFIMGYRYRLGELVNRLANLLVLF
ncbi:hypothetical protein LMHCC_0982 [Listeria monocytogenes HCC23]|uniref:Uncharacterized protein n=1 Tax=Listeria monocytogenes serotype 4a (strain M7) TaxID=1030009 RepID=A0A0E0UX33_LISMM|nr:hypothetical protein LMHCC_0982 [Listeria monocytogenes HCC23]AEH92678.1 hypothetical protein LMM7_1673 [Listeria monocytogenes M7]